MHTEHLENVRPAAVGFGWFVSVAVVSAIGLVLAALGMMEPDGMANSGLWGALAIAIGFSFGGWLIGLRVGLAPILHGVAIGFVSLFVWFVANVVAGEALDAAEWLGDSETYYAGLLILQIAAAAVGARMGSRSQRRAALAG